MLFLKAAIGIMLRKSKRKGFFEFMTRNITCWVVVEDHLTGTKNQCLAVAQALKIKPVIKPVILRQPWAALTPWLGIEQSWSFAEPLPPPYPDLVLAAGRKAIAAARYIKKASEEKSFVVYLQDPNVSSSYFDLVAAPYHDGVKGPNVVVTDGAPTRITKRALIYAREEWAHVFEKLPSPRVAVMVGGDSKTHKLTAKKTEELTEQLKKLDAGLMVAVSRRTGEENARILKRGLIEKPAVIWTGQGKNPYLGMLAWADYILVTEDSVSMLSDAGTTGRPVYWIDMAGGSARFNRMKAHLENLGVIEQFRGNLSPRSYEPLADARKVAEAISSRIKL